MKKTLNALLCVFLLIVMILSLTACNDDGAQKQLDDLQSQLVQQQQQLQQLQELLKQQQEKNEELELQYSALVESIQKLQLYVDRLENSLPCEATVIAGSGYEWNKPETSYLIYTQDTLQQFLDDADWEFRDRYVDEEWHLKADDGTIINKEYFNELSKDFESKALVVSVFLSPCLSARILRQYLWKSADEIHVEIDYTHGNATAVETVMVIMEVDRYYIGDITDVVLELNKPQYYTTLNQEGR